MQLVIEPEGLTDTERKTMEDILNNKYHGEFVKVSNHNHTRFSGEKFLENVTIERIIDEAFKKNIGLITITDKSNDLFFDYLKHLKKDRLNIEIDDDRLIKITKNNKSLYLPRAMELHNNKGHMLLIGYKGNLNNLDKMSLEDITDEVHSKGGIVIPAHPFVTIAGGMGKEKLYSLRTRVNGIDSIEVFNAQAVGPLKRYNEQAKRFAKEHKLGKVCSNDSERINEISRTYMLFPKVLMNEKDAQSYVDSFKRMLWLTKNTGFYKKISHEQYHPLLEVIGWEASYYLHKFLKFL